MNFSDDQEQLLLVTVPIKLIKLTLNLSVIWHNIQCHLKGMEQASY